MTVQQTEQGAGEGVGPLAGVVVVDLGWGMPAGVATMVLADYGAEVIRVERPDRRADPVLDRILQRNKWRVELDPEDPKTAEVLDGLLARADVLIRTAGSPWPARFSDAAALAERHPHLVDTLLEGYPEGGPDAGRPAYDALVSARLGLMAEQRGHRDGPIFLGHPSLDYVTGFLLVIGVLAALRARFHTNRGQHVDTSMFDGALALSTMNWWWNERNISYLARDGKEKGFGRTRLITDKFECADGEYVMVHTGGLGGFYLTMQLLGLEEGIRQVEGADMGTPLDDHEYHVARHVVPEVFKNRNRDEWLKIFHEADLAALPVLRPQEVLDDDQVLHGGAVVSVEDPVLGPMRQIGPVVRFEGSPVGTTRPARLRGQDNDRVETILARPERSVAEPVGTLGSALEGLRVLDFSAYFATAFGVRLLSDLGADVIKVEPTSGEQMRPLADLYEGANRGKRNLAINLRTPEGKEVVRRLIASADVVVHNFRPGKAEKLGIGPDDLRAIKPDIISCYLPGFGSSGPKSHLKSFAPLVSGFTGMLYVAAGEGNPPIQRVMGNEDLYNGFAGAMAMLMAIHHREATGEGQHVESPHLHSSLLVRTEQAADAEGGLIAGLALDADQTGWGPLYRLYRTADHWLAVVAVGQEAFVRLCRALALESLLDDPRFADEDARAANADALAEILTGVFASRTSADTFAELDGAGVACEIPADDPKLPEILWDQWALESGRVYEHYHPEHGWIREIGQTYRLSATPALNKGTSARLGQHTGEVLAELGYDDAAIGDLVGSGVCRQYEAAE